MDPLDIVGIAGSLREESYNAALLRAARSAAPAALGIDIADIERIPLYNQDLDEDDLRPQPVEDLKSRIGRADGVLIASPEYNYGVPGVLKNAIDWVSRPGFASPFADKPVGIIGASAGKGGTMRAQEHLKLHLLGMGAEVYPHPGVAVSQAGQRFDDELQLEDDDTESFLTDYLDGFASWLRERAS